MINMIAAVGQNNEIGKNGELIWPIREDLKFFRETTMGYPVIMGRKTFDSLPKVLDGRRNIVLTRQNIVLPNAEVRSYIRGLITEFKNIDAFVIGGESVYREFMPYTENIYLTEIEETCESSNAHFPNFDKEKFTREVLDNNHDENLNIDYSHVLYKRRH